MIQATPTQLNPQQQAAVTAPLGHHLILAGAGSGKTRVLVHRFAELVKQHQLAPWQLLAVTFTNKAAKQMQQRLTALLNQPTQGLWIGTFHGLAHRMLRRNSQCADLPNNFQVIDSDDQFKLVRQLMKQLSIDEAQIPVKQAQQFINQQKEQAIRAADLTAMHDPFSAAMSALYQIYEQRCRNEYLVDFAELLLRSVELLSQSGPFADDYNQRFRYLLVDEFQDINAIQYRWLRRLSSHQQPVMVVGDDDQSIYSWRGAQVGHIKQFLHDYPNVTMIRLEQNYRCSGRILSLANALIRHNKDRLGKELWTEGGDGVPIDLYSSYNELDEAQFVTRKINHWAEQGIPLSEIAVLYRANAQSRVLEEALLQAQIPYRVYGGLRFFERQEIKDALAYLRLVNNLLDNNAFERIVNCPPRGIGQRTVELIRAAADNNHSSLWQASLNLLENNQLSSRAKQALQQFVDLIQHLSKQCQLIQLTEQVNQVIEQSGLVEHYQKDKTNQQARVDNLYELISAASSFEQDDLTLFLAQTVLAADLEQTADADSQAQVQLMTLHAAKGLEFTAVCLVGLEEGLLPHQQSLTDLDRLAEERRLCYVGITRAKQYLSLSWAAVRRLYGQQQRSKASRFLRELPQEQLTGLGESVDFSIDVIDRQASFQLGQPVIHPRFGEGVVVNQQGQGSQEQVEVQFIEAGNKWLLVSHAKLTPA